MKRGLSIFLAAGLAMTVLQASTVLALQGQWLPDLTCPMVIDAFERLDAAGRWYHDAKSLFTEAFRCDPQWWAKFTVQAIGTLVITNIATLAWVISLKWGRHRNADGG
ncbi:hypothetical protein [Taklimakanibacter deserti]|uniref:hypothetical protein n=1 Tax=Taklimakanibacter deserti TaxID=2267839 RepID=UPI000E64EC56